VFGVPFSSLPSLYSHAKLQIMTTSRPAALPSHFCTNKWGGETKPALWVCTSPPQSPCNPPKAAVRGHAEPTARLLLSAEPEAQISSARHGAPLGSCCCTVSGQEPELRSAWEHLQNTTGATSTKPVTAREHLATVTAKLY